MDSFVQNSLDKVPQTGWLGQEKLIFSQLWKPEVRNGRGAGTALAPSEAVRKTLFQASSSASGGLPVVFGLP